MSGDDLRQDLIEWAGTLEFVGAERNGAEWKDAGLSRSDADELAVLLRSVLNLDWGESGTSTGEKSQ